MKWQKNMCLIDANVILRYLLDDNQLMAQQAKKVVENGAYTKPEIIAEVVYVLKGVYKVGRVDISAYLKLLLQTVKCTEGKAVTYALDLYAQTSLDFIDCLLVAYHELNSETVFTFDKKLNRYLLD